tara:strand:+ start:1196 stop:2116 length:921 start_codon:yes stop_codon:yes gene_type:complete
MSEETTPQEEMTQSEVEEIGMDTEIEFEGKTYTLGDLMQAQSQMGEMQSQLNQLNEFKQSTVQLMSNDSNNDARMKAARVVLSESGYTPREIEEYMSEYGEALNEAPDVGGEIDYTQEETSAEPANMNYEDAEARAEASRASEELRQYRLQMLQREMQNGINNALDSNKQVEVLLGRLKSGDNTENYDKAKSSLQQQVHDQTMKVLQARKAREGTFSEAWVQDAAMEATNEVLGTYRTVIGDIDSIGRAPETVSGEPTLSSKPPVPEPEFKEGMTRGDVDTSVKNWNTDVLSRLAEESSAGDESKA